MKTLFRSMFYCWLLTVIMLMVDGPAVVSASSQRINIPNLGTHPPPEGTFTPSIAWFGQVTPTLNYSDIRTWHYDDYIKIMVNIIDRRLWYDTSFSETDMADWDAVTLYLDTSSNVSNAIEETSYKFVAQLNFWQDDNDYQRVYQGDGSSWTASSIPFTAKSEWRGNAPNDDANDKGWSISFAIPFNSLALNQAPEYGTVWRIAMELHDRDDEVGTPITDQYWPASFSQTVPSTWNELHFGVPVYQPPTNSNPMESIKMRHKLDEAVVVDAHVGGHTTCGSNVDHWSEWGYVNYSGYTQINIQNQWDIADYPCFSKYYVTFPLDSIPKDREIYSATLTMYQFGNSWGEGIVDSWLQTLIVDNDWSEDTINWNNAPQAIENLSGTWVSPMSAPLEWPGVPHQWDVAYAVDKSIRDGIPLKLVIYSADGERHSGRYFSSSDTGDWNAVGRPTLEVVMSDVNSPTPTPSSTPTTCRPGDTSRPCDDDIDIFDYNTLLSEFGQPPPHTADFSVPPDGDVDIFDYNTLLTNFGS